MIPTSRLYNFYEALVSTISSLVIINLFSSTVEGGDASGTHMRWGEGEYLAWGVHKTAAFFSSQVASSLHAQEDCSEK